MGLQEQEEINPNVQERMNRKLRQGSYHDFEDRLSYTVSYKTARVTLSKSNTLSKQTDRHRQKDKKCCVCNKLFENFFLVKIKISLVHFVFIFCFVNLAQARVIWEEGTSVEKISVRLFCGHDWSISFLF